MRVGGTGCASTRTLPVPVKRQRRLVCTVYNIYKYEVNELVHACTRVVVTTRCTTGGCRVRSEAAIAASQGGWCDRKPYHMTTPQFISITYYQEQPRGEQLAQDECKDGLHAVHPRRRCMYVTNFARLRRYCEHVVHTKLRAVRSAASESPAESGHRLRMWDRPVDSRFYRTRVHENCYAVNSTRST